MFQKTFKEKDEFVDFPFFLVFLLPIMRTFKSAFLLAITFIFTTQVFVNVSFAEAVNPVKKVVVAGGFSLILMQDGKLVIRGAGFFDHYDPYGFAILNNGNDNWKDISASDSSIYGIKKDGTMWTAGFNDVGQLGTGDTKSGNKMRQIGKNKKWKVVSSKYAHAVAIAEDGSLWAWGLNGSGQIGDGTITNRHVPTRVGKDTDWVEAYTGAWNTVAVKRDGSLWAWGTTWSSILNVEYDKRGKMAITKPLKLLDKLQYKKISVGSKDTLILMKDGTLWGWGYHIEGQYGLGAGQRLNRISNKKWKDVSASGDGVEVSASYAVKEDGTLWGITKTFREVPQTAADKKQGTTRSLYAGVVLTQVSPDNDWAAVAEQTDSSSNPHPMIFNKRNGTLYGLGNNSAGQLDEPKGKKSFKDTSKIMDMAAFNQLYIQKTGKFVKPEAGSGAPQNNGAANTQTPAASGGEGGLVDPGSAAAPPVDTFHPEAEKRIAAAKQVGLKYGFDVSDERREDSWLCWLNAIDQIRYETVKTGDYPNTISFSGNFDWTDDKMYDATEEIMEQQTGASLGDVKNIMKTILTGNKSVSADTQIGGLNIRYSVQANAIDETYKFQISY